MKSRPGVRIGLLMMMVVLLLAAGQNPPPQAASLPIGSATIGEIKGEVVVRSPQGSPLTALRGLVLAAESQIETGKGSILLDLQDGSQVLVKSHSNVVLKAPNEGRGFSLELLLGKIFAKVQKRLENTPSFRMGTPTAVITVRGTRFSVEVNKKQRTLVEVFEGVVEVANVADGTRPVLIRPGFFTRVAPDRVPDEPRQMIDRGEGPGSDDSRERNRPDQPGGGWDREDQGQPRQGSQSEPPDRGPD
jgi:hypothetical protein